MLQSLHVQDCFPPPAYKHWEIDRIRFTRAIFEPGMWQEMQFPDCNGYCEIDTSHIQTEGTLVDLAGVLAPREAGWMSSEDHWPIPAGVHRRTAISRAVVWCARPIDKVGSIWHLDEVRLFVGQELPLEPGHQLFLISGQLACGSVTIDPFTHLQIGNEERVLTAQCLSYLFVWKSGKT